jgi:putative ATP-binding cassette transporter
MRLFRAKLFITVLILLLIIDCSLSGFIAVWREWYWQALVDKKFYLWLWYVGQFSVIALISCFIAGMSSYISNIVGLHYRTGFTKKGLQLDYTKIEGGNQRVQQDCNDYPQLLIQLILGLGRSIIMIGVFVIVIAYQLPVQYFILPIVYTVIGTYLAAKISKPLINLNYINQVVEAKFRQILNKINYIEVHKNNRLLYKNLKYLNYFQSFFNQITIIIPHIMLLFVYFSGKITFGIFMQVASSMNELISNMSYFINSFDVINRFISCRKRLKELGVI